MGRHCRRRRCVRVYVCFCVCVCVRVCACFTRHMSHVTRRWQGHLVRRAPGSDHFDYRFVVVVVVMMVVLIIMVLVVVVMMKIMMTVTKVVVAVVMFWTCMPTAAQADSTLQFVPWAGEDRHASGDV